VSILSNPDFQGEEKKESRRSLVMKKVHEYFDFFEMSKRVYGRQWLDLSYEQQKEFVGLFTTLLEHAYIGKIEDYSDQTVTFEKERRKGDLAEVQTLLKNKDVSLPVSYLMLYKEDRWVVFDVAVERVSIARNYREQFRQVLKEESYDGLIRKLNEKIRVLEAK
jgi:phospholipid transport system substrate-binding protein